MDVEMQMNGLPTQFGEQAAAENASHEASNILAVAANVQHSSMMPVKPAGESEFMTGHSALPNNHKTHEHQDQDTVMTSGNEESVAPPIEPASPLPPNGKYVDPSVNENAPDFIHPPSSRESHNTVPTLIDSQNLSSSLAPASSDSSAPSQSVLQSGLDLSSLQPAHLPDTTSEPSAVPQPALSDLRSSSQEHSALSTAETTLPSVFDEAQPGSSFGEKSSQDHVPMSTSHDDASHLDTAMIDTGLLASEQHSNAVPDLSQGPTPSDDRDMDASFTAPVAADIKVPEPTVAELPPAPRPAPAVLPLEHSEQSQEMSDTVAPPTVPETTPATNVAAQAPVDQQMTEETTPPTKVAREREEDQEESEPLAKRMRTEGELGRSDFKVPDVPNGDHAPTTANGEAETAADAVSEEDDHVTPARLAHMKKIISNLKKGNSSVHFRQPVDVVALKIPQYYDIIKEPMDLSVIDRKLKGNEYSTVHEFVRDFNLIVDNSITFNGADHVVSQAAVKMQHSFTNQMQHMPKAGVVEPSREEKKALKLKTEPIRQAPPRRPSVTTPAVSQSGSARSPRSAGQSQTFAVGPEGVPLIRRDSNIVDGRPKRAIVPTKRNNDFGSGRPKKKKFELQLRFCQEVLNDLMSDKNWEINQYFLTPVDPVALNIPTYFQIIKKPMSLSVVAAHLSNGEYEKAKDFEDDIRLIFKNCYKFNPEGDHVNTMGHKLEEYFDKKWENKDDWIAAREPNSEPQSGGEDDEDDDDEEEEEEDAEHDSEDDRNEKIKELQKQIEMMSKKMGELTAPKKKKSTPPMPLKKGSKAKKEKKDRTSTASAVGDGASKKAKDKKKPKPKPEKERFVTYAEKQYISNGISHLPDKAMGDALRIIQQNVPHLRDTAETEIELDIDELPNGVLLKLLNFVKKFAGPPPSEVKEEKSFSATTSSGKPKKNKPMNKADQEAQIKELRSKLNTYDAPSPDAHPSVEKAEDDSDDDDEEEESEEE